MTGPAATPPSPLWGPTVKLIVGLTFVAIVAGLVLSFSNVIGPLLLAFILAYVLHPIVSWLSQKTSLSWRAGVNLIYLVAVIVVLTLFTVMGFALVQQAQNLVGAVQVFFTGLPARVAELSTRVYLIGPFTLDFGQILSQVDINALLDQVVGIVQPVLGRAGGLVSALASGTVSTLGWGFFVLLVSFFILADGGNVATNLGDLEIPGYNDDLRRLGRQLGRIWNAFMRGQVILFTLTVISSGLLLSLLGVRNALALSLLAGTARFVPYVGPFVTWAVTGVVAVLQPTNYFGLPPATYVTLVLIAIIVLDQAFDNLITPRLYGQVLGVHPAAVLVSAIVAAGLIGFVGLLLAAPVLATLILFGRYALRKMLDLPAWPEPETEPEPAQFPGVPVLRRLWGKLRASRRARPEDS